jgi:hypothetical protein
MITKNGKLNLKIKNGEPRIDVIEFKFDCSDYGHGESSVTDISDWLLENFVDQFKIFGLTLSKDQEVIYASKSK